MGTKKKLRNRLLGRILALTMAVCLLLSLAITANAADVNQKVIDAKQGVVQIQVWFHDPEMAVEQQLHYGTGFLINENTVVTCQHVATGFPDEWYVQWAQLTNEKLGGKRTAKEVKEHLELRISVYRDVYIKATIKKVSQEMDYAVLALEQSVNGRTSLKLRDSSTLEQTEAVHALGFPGDVVSVTATQRFDADDVTITSGYVNKIDVFDIPFSDGSVYHNVDCVESSATIRGGNSGGPLVDAAGNVVGINAAGDDTRNFAICSKQLINVLKALGIEYTSADSLPPENSENTDPVQDTPDTKEISDLISEAEEIDEQDYTEDSYKNLKKALKDSKAALSATTQSEVDTAASELKDAIDNLEKAESKSTLSQNDEKSDLSKYIIIGIAAFVVLVIVIVVILLVVLGKKNSKQRVTPAAQTYQQPVQQRPVAPVAAPVAAQTYQQPAQQRPAAPVAAPVAAQTYQQPVQQRPVAPASSETTVLNQGASETTVLAQGAGETTVLSQNVNGGFLVRSSNNEKIPICSAEFTVGRERNSVDYCVGGNTNISRVHARFVVRDGKTYIVDNKAANGTFVNGVKARTGQEIELKDGDKVLLADEKFEYKK